MRNKLLFVLLLCVIMAGTPIGNSQGGVETANIETFKVFNLQSIERQHHVERLFLELKSARIMYNAKYDRLNRVYDEFKRQEVD